MTTKIAEEHILIWKQVMPVHMNGKNHFLQTAKDLRLNYKPQLCVVCEIKYFLNDENESREQTYQARNSSTSGQ